MLGVWRPTVIRSRRHAGYVLLLTLLLIPVAGVALAALARVSLGQALEARNAEAALQRRWASLSVRRALLPQTEGLLAAAEQETREPVRALDRTLRLGGLTLHLVLFDEQAKANLNSLYARRDAEAFEASLAALLGTTDGRLRIHPRPAVPRPARSSTEPVLLVRAFEGFGQLFEAPAPFQLLAGDATAPVANLTLWGDGRLNLRRASPETLAEVCRPILGPHDIHKLLAARQEHPGLGLGKLLESLELPRDQQALLQRLLTDTSSCSSLWIVTSTPDRRWYELAVSQQSRSTAGQQTGSMTRWTW